MGRRRITSIVMDEEVWNSFCDFVRMKYGQKWKFLGEELSRALVAWMDAHANREENSNSSHLEGGTKSVGQAEAVYRELLRSVPPGNARVSSQHVENAIIRVAGGDRRTIQKYTRMLVALGYLRPSFTGSGGFNCYVLRRGEEVTK